MKGRRWIKVALWVVLTPILLFALLMVLLYVPPVQNFIREKATVIASEATGMDISIRRIDLHFPLNLRIQGVQVAQRTDSLPTTPPDTLLTLGTLDIRVQAMPLFHGQVEIDQILLKQVGVNSAGLIEGMTLKGELGRFLLQSHGVDLLDETVILNRVDLADTHLHVVLADTAQPTPPDTTTTALNWKIALHNLSLKNVSVDLDMPLDTMSLRAHVPDASIEDADVDLGRSDYGCRRLGLAGASVSYDTGNSVPASGFDASHLTLRDLTVGIDSVRACGRDMKAVIREFSFYERSGLNVASLTGRFSSDSTVIRVPSLQLRTSHSEIDLAAQTYWELVEIPTTGRLTARLDARIGKQDILLFAGGLPESFKEAYPFRPLVIRAGTVGNLKEMQISRLMVDLPGAFSISGGGGLWNVTDSVSRRIGMELDMHTYDLNFLTTLTGEQPDGSILVPDSMDLMASLSLEGTQCNALLKLNEQQGTLDLNAAYNLDSEEYVADLVIDSLQVNHFLPRDSIYMLTASLSAKGKGTDIASAQTVSAVRLKLAEIQYGQWDVSNVALDAGLKSSVVGVKLSSDNPLLKMQTRADLRLDKSYLDGKIDIDVKDVNLHQLGVVPRPLEHPFAFNLGAEARHDSIKLNLEAGDLDFQFRARSTLKGLIERSSAFASLLGKQVEERRLDHAALRRALPSAGMQLTAGKQNPVSYFLQAQNITYDDFMLRFGFTPTRGINGQTFVRGLRTDSLQLDTIFFAIAQDTTRMRLQGGVVNGPENPQFVFRSTLTGEIRNEDADLVVQYVDDEGDTGIHFGINARPLTEGHGKGNGVLLRLLPEEPVIAYRKFRFVDGKNSIYLHKNMRVYADIDMDEEKDDMGFRMQSDIHDTVSLQNINIELSRFRLNELSEVMPYLPRLSGLFSAQAHYIQTPNSLQVSASANVDSLTYEQRWVGNIGVGGTWLPENEDRHRLHAYFSNDRREILTADGVLASSGETQTADVNIKLDKLPLSLANAFVPDRMAMMRGELNGQVSVEGTLEKPTINGELAFDTASVYIRQLGARYWFDSRPIRLKDNVASFDNFSLYTTSRNPFMITGSVDFRNLERPMADIRLFADNYTLLDAKRRRSSIVYGKVVVGVDAYVRGPLDALTMRGSMNLLGTTDVTYVLTDSPLTVEDRLDGLVSFVSFADTTSTETTDVPTVSLGGMDVSMVVGIDDAVRLRADLTEDGSKYVELEGGGSLTLQLTPQGDMTLMGRYTLSGGTMKYSLPIIPLKEFKLASGSYVDWRGDVMDPVLSLKATERIRSSVDDGDGASRPVDFDVSIAIGGRLSAPDLVFDLVAPEDATVQNELQAMGAEERSKQAIAMMATGIYLANSGGGGLSMGSALNSVLQSQINSLAGSVKGASISVGIEDRTSAETGDTQKDFSFKYSQRFFNDRIQVNIGGKVSTGANATNNAESFIDNISLEYRLDTSGTRYVRAFYNKNNESILDGEITETGAGLVLRRKMDRLSELFIFRRKRPSPKKVEVDETTEDEATTETDKTKEDKTTEEL